MKDITLFVKNTLYPLLFERVEQAFPEMAFKRYRGKWLSPKNIDGSEPQHARSDKSVITPRRPTRIYENGGGGSKDLITLYKDLNGLSSNYEAIEQLSKIVGAEPPERSEEEANKWRSYKEQQDKKEASLNRQKAALYAPEGKAVLDYLHSRGWNDEEIKEAELGYISEAEAEALEAQRGIGRDYTLSIPLRSGGFVYGFKFRTISPEVESDKSKGKYKYLYGTSKSENLFSLSGIKQTDGALVVVEGELDALHAQVKGVTDHYVATSGGSLSKELLQKALQRGYKRVTLLLDNDDSGRKYVERSIEAARELGVTILVASLPDGVKDTDEFLQTHTAQELDSLVAEALKGSKYLLLELLKRYETERATDAQVTDFINEAIVIANKAATEPERDEVLANIPLLIGGSGITKEAIQAVADRERVAQDALKQKERTAEALNKATELLRNGETVSALQTMGDAAKELSRIDKRAKYAHLLQKPTEREIESRIRSKQGELSTLYEFTLSTGEKERLTLPSGAITFVCAQTSHGKSTLLQNIALQVAQDPTEGDTLYFTFEEDADSVLLQMENKYINYPLCQSYNNGVSNNLRAINHYYRTGEDRYIRTENRAIFHDRRAAFMADLVTSGKLRLYYEDYDSTELIDAIKEISSQIKVKAVFIDYIQLLNINGTRLSRTEELKQICKELKTLAIDKQLPIIVAAQLNREATSPLELHSQNIAEAADLERIANKIICLWNSSFNSRKSKDSQKDIEELEARHGFKLGTSGKIYAKMTKNRGGAVGAEVVLDYNGNTGVIKPNVAAPKAEAPEDPKLFADLSPMEKAKLEAEGKTPF